MKKEKKILYISDLDGTLLCSNARISPWSCDVINSLTEKGLLFSYATARSIYTAVTVTQGFVPKLPVIVNNGTFLMDSTVKKYIHTNRFLPAEAHDIYTVLQFCGIAPLVDSIIHGEEKFSYNIHAINSATRDFVSERNDARNTPLTDTGTILQGDVFYFTCIGEEAKLKKAHQILRDNYNCLFHHDIYSNEPWLEIMPHSATKAHAAVQLKELLHCDRVVVFGDGANDIPMFHAADESYAMENAIDALKVVATAVIDSNEQDGVAKWLLKNGICR